MMSFQETAKQRLADFSLIIGKALFYSGGLALFLMACVGTLSIDIVMLACAEKHHDQFLTGIILGSMFGRGSYDPMPLIMASPITSALAVALSVYLGVPGVGVAIVAGWILSTTIFIMGCGLFALSETLSNNDDYQTNAYQTAAFA
ncbi:hypothetical protein [Legionella sp. W05-934-2]|uniref:hypothetical protein n=1 Tax=Legionella sp. W05-934-2 TaxID=1198649 RepID=UPI0034623360